MLLKTLLFLCILKIVFNQLKSIFSKDSKLTLVTTSCGRMNLLKITYETMFEHNHYPLREIRIIDDCSTPEEKIMACLPIKPEQKEFVKIIVNEAHLGQFASIDRLYQGIKTKFVLHLQDDFRALPNDRIILKAIHFLEYAEKKNQKVIQVAFARQLFHHLYRSELMTTPSNISYFIKYGTPDRRYDYTLQPNIINYPLVYKKMLNSSIVRTIGPMCQKCLQTQREKNIRCVNCFEPKLGEFFQRRGWHTVILDDDRDDGGWEHIGDLGDHVSMIKREELQYYKVFITCFVVLQLFRLIEYILLYYANSSKINTQPQSEECFEEK